MSLQNAQRVHHYAQSMRVSRPQPAGESGRSVIAKAMQSPACLQSGLLMVGGIAVALAYTCVFVMLDAAAAIRWVQATEPVTHSIVRVVPLLNQVATELVMRGFSLRTAMVSHVLAFQWLILAAVFIAAAPRIIVGRAELRRAIVDAARGARPRASGFALLAACLVVLWFGWGSTLGYARLTGRFGYDLAVGNGGLFFPFLVMIAMWWLALFTIWARVMAALARDELPEMTSAGGGGVPLRWNRGSR
jgi:hypothetical protein